MTSPRFAETTARGRYYTRPGSGEQLISVTNAINTALAKPALLYWATKVVAEHAIEHLPQLIHQTRVDRDGAIKDLKGQVNATRDKASNLGSRIHALAEAHATGQLIAAEPGDAECEPYVRQYLKFLKDFSVDLGRDVVAAEMTVADPGLGYAGTLDAVMTLPIGVEATSTGLKTYALGPGPHERIPWMIDYKTSATRDSASVYGEYALQLAALRDAREVWLPDGTIDAMPRVAGSAVLNLRRSTYALIPLPFTDRERKTWRAILQVAQWAHTVGADISGGEVYRPVDADGRTIPKRARKVA